MMETISLNELKRKIENQDDFRLLETLPRNAFEHAHLPGAINIPPDRVAEFASELLPDKSAEIVVYCSSPD